MISLYLHIPYCVQKCGYCDFNSFAGASLSEQEGYVRALCQEMQHWSVRPELAGAPVPTLFVGGGTPTLLEGRLLTELLMTARSYFALSSDAEVTVEANPGTIDVADDKLLRLREAGANRLSLGVQAYQVPLLERLGRIHTPEQVEAAVQMARAAGFTNINLDLMYGLPGQQVGDVEETVRWALSLAPTHMSAYSLILEEGTPFFAAYESGRLFLPPEEEEEEMFQVVRNMLLEAGFEHYEVSNFAQPGYRSRHNQVYWKNDHYLGLGCGAHSFLELAAPLPNQGVARPRLSASRVQGGSEVQTISGDAGQRYRFWNLRTPTAYRSALEQGGLPVEAGEVLTSAIEMAETMIMGLRLLEGVSEERFVCRFGRSIQAVYDTALTRLQEQGLLRWQEGHIRLTARGLRLGNQVWQAFLPG